MDRQQKKIEKFLYKRGKIGRSFIGTFETCLFLIWFKGEYSVQFIDYSEPKRVLCTTETNKQKKEESRIQLKQTKTKTITKCNEIGYRKKKESRILRR